MRGRRKMKESNKYERTFKPVKDFTEANKTRSEYLLSEDGPFYKLLDSCKSLIDL